MPEFVKFIALLKFRTDNVASFLTYLNFILLTITASPSIQKLFASLGFVMPTAIIALMLILFLGVFTLIVGYLLDVHGSYWQNLMTVQNQRNPQLQQIIENTELILGRQNTMDKQKDRFKKVSYKESEKCRKLKEFKEEGK